MWSNVFEYLQNIAYSLSTDLMHKHYGKRASQTGFKNLSTEDPSLV